MILPDQPERSSLERHNLLGRIAEAMGGMFALEVVRPSVSAGMPEDDARSILSTVSVIAVIIGNGGIAPSLAKVRQEVVDGLPDAALYLSAIERIRDFPIPTFMGDDAEPRS